jgi:hypothetical protein
MRPGIIPNLTNTATINAIKTRRTIQANTSMKAIGTIPPASDLWRETATNV